MKESKMTVIGSVDPIEIVTKLKKHHCHCDILTVGPPADPKKGDEKKPDPKKEAEKKKEANQQQAQMFHPYTNHPHNLNYNYRLVSPDENPNGCVIC
ncbi:unnamed protein product [Linum tenue]|uniref:Uncharacterized protein n=1 Tax=Linum tenue TaxID=586396 RepID=A0AAV0K002_9ROSI|nr:unnamed protein product [Linum tenue]